MEDPKLCSEIGCKCDICTRLTHSQLVSLVRASIHSLYILESTGKEQLGDDPVAYRKHTACRLREVLHVLDPEFHAPPDWGKDHKPCACDYCKSQCLRG